MHVAAREPLALDPGTGTGTGTGTGDQDRVDTRTDRERNIDAVIAEGKRRGMSDKAIRSAVATMLAESDGRNLANPNDPESLNFQHESLGYDHDSSGVFQQRNNGAWGTAEDRMDPAKAAGMFYDEYTRKNGDSMSEAEAAQAVQQSAVRDGSNYASQLDEADKLIAESNARGQGADYAVGTTSSGATLMTDGQRVFVTNWPATLRAAEASSGTPSAPKTVSVSGGGSGGGTPQTAGLPVPSNPPEQLSTRFGEFGTQAGEIGTQAALDVFGLGGTLLDPNHRYWKAIRDTGAAFAGMNEQGGAGATSPSMRRNGVQIANNITVSNDQEQIRKLLEMTKRLLMQHGGAGA